MPQVKTRMLADLTKKEARKGLAREGNYCLDCVNGYCPVLKSINNAFAIGEEKLFPQPTKLSELFPGEREYDENIEPSEHLLARTALEGMGFSFDPSQQTEINDKRALFQRNRNTIGFRESLINLSSQKRTSLSDSGIHIVTDPGFGYD